MRYSTIKPRRYGSIDNHLTQPYAKWRTSKLSRLLLEKGAHVNAVAKFNNTTLVWASRNGHERIVPLLFEKGAHINAAAEFGDTALVWALRK